MADGFKIADAYVEVVAEMDDRAVTRSATAAGDKAGTVISDRASKGIERGISRDNRGRFVSAGGASGMDIGAGAAKGFAGVVKSGVFANPIKAGLTSPHVIAGVAAAGVLLAPVLGAAISGAMIMGAGAGVLGLGIMMQKEHPAVKKEAGLLAKEVKDTFTKASKPMIKPMIGSLNIMRDFVKEDLGPSFTRMFKDIAPSMQVLTSGGIKMVRAMLPGIEAMVKAAGPFFDGLAEVLPVLGEGISTMFEGFAAGGPGATLFFKDFIRYIAVTIAQFGIFMGWLSRGYVHLRKFFTSIPGWIATAGAWFSNLWSTVSNFFTGIGSSIASGYNSFINFFKGIGSAISGFVSSVGAWFAAIPGKIMGGLNAAWSFISSWGSRIGNFFMSLPGRIGSFLMSLPGILANAANTAFHAFLFAVGYGIGAVIKFFIDLPGRARSALSTLWSAISGAWNAAKTGAVNAATALVNGAINFFRTAPGKARAAFASLWSSISGAFTSARTNATNTANNLVTSVVNFFRQLPGKARSAVSSLWSNMVGAFNSARSAASSSASSLVNGAVSYLRSLPGKARSAVSGIKSSILGVFSGAGGWLRSAGSAIMSGLAAGIRAAVGQAISAAVGAMKSVLNGAKSALGINSPSTVFRDQVGKWLLPGAVVGVKKSVPAARRAIAAATARIIPQVHAASQALRPNTSRPGAVVDAGNGTTYVFAAGSVTLDASKLKSIEDVVSMIGGIQHSARSRYARAATMAGA